MPMLSQTVRFARTGAHRGPRSALRVGLIGLAVAGVLAGCASRGPNPDIERARADVNRIAANPVVAQRSPLEIKAATDTVEEADRYWRDEGGEEEARHRAYLATQRAAIAENLARAREAEAQVSLARAGADKAQLDARTREAMDARQIAAQQAQRADAAEARLREIQATQTERGLLVTMGDVLFETGKSELLAAAYPRVDQLAQFLRQQPERRLLIEGYTDSVGSESMNLALSQRRAEAVRMALAQRGVDSARMTTQGYGEAHPVADNGTSEGRAMNRRVEVLITDDRGTLRPRG